MADVQAGHLKNLTIGVMGCINGPGEMIDADFGYVGAGNGLVALYKGRGAGAEERTGERNVRRMQVCRSL